MENIQENVLKDDALFSLPGFFSPSSSSKLCDEADGGKQFRTPMLDFEKRIESDLVSENNPRIVFDFSHRLLEELEQGLSAVKPAIEDYFSLSLGDQANPHITIWNPGSFIGYHADAVDISASAKSTELRIVVLLFLNDNVDYELKVKSPKTYKGGNLVIYSLMKGEKFEKYGYPIKGKTGNLVAFKANSPHEVTPVISGTRYVLKTGFH